MKPVPGALASQSRRIDELVGSPGGLQQALDLLEKLEPKADPKPADEPRRPRVSEPRECEAQLRLIGGRFSSRFDPFHGSR